MSELTTPEQIARALRSEASMASRSGQMQSLERLADAVLALTEQLDEAQQEARDNHNLAVEWQTKALIEQESESMTGHHLADAIRDRFSWSPSGPREDSPLGHWLDDNFTITRKPGTDERCPECRARGSHKMDCSKGR